MAGVHVLRFAMTADITFVDTAGIDFVKAIQVDPNAVSGNVEARTKSRLGVENDILYLIGMHGLECSRQERVDSFHDAQDLRNFIFEMLANVMNDRGFFLRPTGPAFLRRFVIPAQGSTRVLRDRVVRHLELLLRDRQMAAGDWPPVLLFGDLLVPHVPDPALEGPVRLAADRAREIIAIPDPRIGLPQNQTLAVEWSWNHGTLFRIRDGRMQSTVHVDVMRHQRWQR